MIVCKLKSATELMYDCEKKRIKSQPALKEQSSCMSSPHSRESFEAFSCSDILSVDKVAFCAEVLGRNMDQKVHSATVADKSLSQSKPGGSDRVAESKLNEGNPRKNNFSRTFAGGSS